MVNIVGYNSWYKESPWNRYGTNLKDFDVSYNENRVDITYFIKDGIFDVENFDSKIKVALLTECRIMDKRRHNFLEENSHFFDFIVTYDDELIKSFPNKSIITPYGGTWIHPSIQQIYDKTKICSYITSKKTYTNNQHMRINLLDYFYKNEDQNIELFGRGHNPLPEDHNSNKLDGKIFALKDFAFSLVIENHIQKNYFSEKLMDCFTTGTIPIYFGCTEIDKYFNTRGMIILDNVFDIKEIINTLNLSKYQEMKKYIEENFHLSKQYIDSLSYSYKQIKKKI